MTSHEPLPWWTAPDAVRAELPHPRPPPRAQPWTLVRLVESAFPPDGFAEATRFEAAHQAGRVRSSVELAAFLEEALWEIGTFGLPFLRATRGDPAVHAAADGVCDAAMRDPVTRRASRETGLAFLGCAAGFSPATSRLVADARSRRVAGHLAPAFGAVLGLLGAGDDDACRLFLFLGARGIVSAAVRLGVVGPLEGHAVLTAAAPVIQAVLRHCPAARPPEGVSAAAASPLRGAGGRPAHDHPAPVYLARVSRPSALRRVDYA